MKDHKPSGEEKSQSKYFKIFMLNRWISCSQRCVIVKTWHDYDTRHFLNDKYLQSKTPILILAPNIGKQIFDR